MNIVLVPLILTDCLKFTRLCQSSASGPFPDLSDLAPEGFNKRIARPLTFHTACLPTFGSLFSLFLTLVRRVICAGGHEPVGSSYIISCSLYRLSPSWSFSLSHIYGIEVNRCISNFSEWIVRCPLVLITRAVSNASLGVLRGHSEAIQRPPSRLFLQDGRNASPQPSCAGCPG